MKPRNYIMALVAKNDPTRYHTRSVEAEHIKVQRNRARRCIQERREICEGSAESGLRSSMEHSVIGKMISNQLRCGVTQVVKGTGCGPVIASSNLVRHPNVANL